MGARRLTELLDRFGADTVDAAIDELRRRSERQMRANIAEIPDGTYSFSSDLDGDGVVADQPLTIQLEMTVRGSDIDFDLSKSSPPCRGPLNAVWAITRTAIYVAIKHIFPEVPINSGASSRCMSSRSGHFCTRNIRGRSRAAPPRCRNA